MSGYLERLAARITGTGERKSLSPSLAGWPDRKPQDRDHTMEQSIKPNEEDISGVTPSGVRLSGFEHRNETAQAILPRGITPIFPEYPSDSPASLPGAAGDVFEVRSTKTVHQIKQARAGSNPGRNLPALAEQKASADALQSIPQLDAGTPQGEGLRVEAALGMERDSSYGPGERHAEASTHIYQPLNAVDETRLPHVSRKESEASAPEKKPRRFFREASESFDVAIAIPRFSHVEPVREADAEAGFPSQLSPRQAALQQPSTPLNAADQPRLVIGRLSVEVVQQPQPDARRAVRVPAPAPRQTGEKLSSREIGPRTKLNFGLGQI